MHDHQEKLVRFSTTVLMILAVAFALSLQASEPPRSSRQSAWINRHPLAMAAAARERSTRGAPEDWSHRHLVFSNPGSEEQAVRSGRFDAWMHITNDPRFIMQQKKRATGSKPLADRGVSSLLGRNRNWHLPKPWGGPVAKRMHRDWGNGLNAGNPSPVSYPAKWSFDTTTASCANDFVIYPTGATSSGTQASIIAYDNIYTGCGGTVPTVDWAFDTGGAITGAPSFSYDGSQIAFIQTTAGAASLVILRLPATPAGTGTVDAPVSLTALSPTDYATCAAPCMTAIALAGNPTDTLSNPWIEYASDTLYVGDDAGKLHQFGPVFRGTAANPAAETITGWPVALGTAALGSPVFDTGTGEVFVGSAAGVFYAVGAGVPGYPAIVSGQIYGTSDTLGASANEIVDAPIVDSEAAMAYVFVQSDTNGNNAVFQFPTTFTSGSGTEQAVGTFGDSAEYFLSGAFDNLYFDSESACDSGCMPTGNLYVGGNTAGPATLYQIPITANVMGAAVVGPKLETASILPQLAARNSPVTEFFNPNGMAATANVDIVGDPAGWTSGGPRSVTLGTVTYHFVTGTLDPSTATDVDVLLVDSDGSSVPNQEDTAINLAAAINADPTLCSNNTPCFGNGTVANAVATAFNDGASEIDILTATTGGAAGDFTVSEIGGGISTAGGDNGGPLDLIFLSTYSRTGVAGCPMGCVVSFDVTSGATITPTTAPKAALGVTAINTDNANGFVTGGIIVDNELMSGALLGTSQIYYLTLDNAAGPCGTTGTGVCAVQVSQVGLN